MIPPVCPHQLELEMQLLVLMGPLGPPGHSQFYWKLLEQLACSLQQACSK